MAKDDEVTEEVPAGTKGSRTPAPAPVTSRRPPARVATGPAGMERPALRFAIMFAVVLFGSIGLITFGVFQGRFLYSGYLHGGL